MKNWTFALALGAMVCVGGGAYADGSVGKIMNDSCGVVAKDMSNNNSSAIKQDGMAILAEWNLRDASRLKAGENPLIDGLSNDDLTMMTAEGVTWCAQHPSETVSQAADDYYNQGLAASQSPSQ